MSELLTAEEYKRQLEVALKIISRRGLGFEAPFQIKEFDLTSARTNEEVKFAPCQFIQAVCDGGLDGVTIKLSSKNVLGIPLNILDTLPCENTDTLYLTNEVRTGRSRLRLYFCQTSAFGRHYTGDPVSMAELASRLGSINVFDRRGEVIWEDNFEDNIEKWVYGFDGTGGSVSLSAAEALFGAKSCRLVTGGDAAGDYAGMNRTLRAVGTGIFGFEVAIRLSSANPRYAELYLAYNDSVNIHWSKIRYDHPNEELLYLNSSNTFTKLADLKLNPGPNQFHVFKLVADFVNNKYKRLLVNETAYDVADLDLYSVASGALDYTFIYVELLVDTSAGVNATYYVDAAIVTQNEP